jgi:hypothetical protein
MKIGNMTDRELIVWIVGEVRSNKKVLLGEIRQNRALISNHLSYHEKQGNRQWKLYLGLLLATISVSGSIIVAFLT